MSSSFTDQPPPDPQGDPGYTSTPPVRGQTPDDRRDEVTTVPKLGSLAQKARGKQLRQARIILFIVGGLTILVNVADIAMVRSSFQKEVEKEIQKQGGRGQVQIDRAFIQKKEDEVFLLASIIDGAFILTGILFLIFGAIIYRFPVPVTIASLTLYILTWILGILIAFAIDPVAAASVAGGGIIIRIIFIVILAKSIQSALAYERERREAVELA